MAGGGWKPGSQRVSGYEPLRKDHPLNIAKAEVALNMRDDLDTLLVSTMCAVHNLKEATANRLIEAERAKRGGRD